MQGKGATVVGISTDDVETLRRFHAELALPFELLSDASGEVSRAYGGTTLGMADRTTVVVDEDGRILRITTGSEAIDPRGEIRSCPLRRPRAAPDAPVGAASAGSSPPARASPPGPASVATPAGPVGAAPVSPVAAPAPP